MIALIVLLVVVALLTLWIVGSYNRLVGMKNPTLKSNHNVRALMEELTGTENKVGFARQFYNDIATKYNTAQQVFPTNQFAATFGFKNAELFEITNEVEREALVVDLSRK